MSTELQDMSPPVNAHTTCQLNFYDGTNRTVYDTDIEQPYPDGKLIVSRTDLAGILTHVNDAFVEISGYTKDKLIGYPQHILRHPDMPKAAYADLWQTVKSGKKWHGYVKNLCANGSHYWVYATVVPNIREGEIIGYTSVRRKPSRSKIQHAITEYTKMKSGECS